MLRPGLLAEARTVHHHHVLLQDEFFHEDVVALGDIDARIGVERATGRNAAYTGSGIAPLHSKIAAGAQLLLDFDQMVLRPLERWLDGVLLGMVSAQACPQQALNAFVVVLYGCRFAAHDAPS